VGAGCVSQRDLLGDEGRRGVEIPTRRRDVGVEAERDDEWCQGTGGPSRIDLPGAEL
jgi:hypothetical protein